MKIGIRQIRPVGEPGSFHSHHRGCRTIERKSAAAVPTALLHGVRAAADVERLLRRRAQQDQTVISASPFACMYPALKVAPPRRQAPFQNPAAHRIAPKADNHDLRTDVGGAAAGGPPSPA